MTILPLDPMANATPEALGAFFARCREAARARGRAQLVSISVAVDALDPLAVLESIFEPGERHFYVEREAQGWALAGAEAVLSHTAGGAGRFADVQRWIDDTLANTVAVGAVGVDFGGPHFLTAFAFADEVEAGEAFAAATVFVPRWQVARAGGRTLAVANIVVAPDAALEPLVERVWRAHAKFRAFDYEGPDGAARGGREGAGVGEVAGGRGDSAAAAAESVAAVPIAGAIQARDIIAPEQYLAAVARGTGLIREGVFRKIVLGRAREIEAPRVLHPLTVLAGLRERFPDCYAFSVADGAGHSFIGASPERLLQVRGGQLWTEALAGSARRGASASEDATLGGALLRAEKDLREHALVVASIRRRLEPLGLALEHAERPALRRLLNVQHLHTPIRATLPAGVRLLDVLARLHPTPAVGGSPREAAVPHIRGLEGFPRGLYAGALGWIDARGDGEFCVGLRCALVRGPVARLYAGAGIVEGSDPQRELAETELKFSALQSALLG